MAGDLGGTDIAAPVTVDVTDEAQIAAALRAAVLAFGGVDLVVNNAGLSLSKPLLETSTVDWDVQHAVLARGSFLVSREAARIMVAQGMGGEIVYIASKNAVFAGPEVRPVALVTTAEAPVQLLSLPDAGRLALERQPGLAALRASVASAEDQRRALDGLKLASLLKREVLPEHVAAAVFALTAGDLSQTTGLLVPVDAGVAAAFLR